uniref:Uncharacterized protein n=1 Tax=Rhizophagus irregularis (strain DAOM 181602 / DAOM 197198 / MUCL 43194) TaxID=747089 RepID=U9UR81_RHIID
MSQSSQSSQSSVINNEYEWCKQCQINFLTENFTKWTSENEIIDDFIQETQLNVDEYDNVLFEWILYNQFNVKEISKSDSTPVKAYLANETEIYGISQNPDTKDYVMVLKKE